MLAMKEARIIKRRNPEKSRAKIIAAAQKAFAERGYAQTGLRDIAALADVSSALPVTYFDTKAGLFEAALRSALDMNVVTGGDKEDFGKRLIQAVLNPDMPITIPAMIAHSIGDDEAVAIARRFTKENIIIPVAKWLGPPSARARAYLILMISTGFVIYSRHVLIDEKSRGGGHTTRWLVNTIQALVDGDEETISAFLRNRARKSTIL